MSDAPLIYFFAYYILAVQNYTIHYITIDKGVGLGVFAVCGVTRRRTGQHAADFDERWAVVLICTLGAAGPSLALQVEL